MSTRVPNRLLKKAERWEGLPFVVGDLIVHLPDQVFCHVSNVFISILLSYNLNVFRPIRPLRKVRLDVPGTNCRCSLSHYATKSPASNRAPVTG